MLILEESAQNGHQRSWTFILRVFLLDHCPGDAMFLQVNLLTLFRPLNRSHLRRHLGRGVGATGRPRPPVRVPTLQRPAVAVVGDRAAL